MKRLALVGALLGMGLLGALVAYSGLGDVVDAAEKAGWAALAVTAIRGVALAACGLAWLLLFPPGRGPSVAVSVLLRFVREAINQLLPVGQVGGDVVGARLATFWRVDGALAGATTLLDVALQAATQLVFALIGLALLLVLGGGGEVVRLAAIGLGVTVAGLAAAALIQLRMRAGWVGRLLGMLPERYGRAVLDRLWDRFAGLLADRRALLSVSALHLSIWFVGALEVYVALPAMGYPVTFAEAVIIESLGQAVRGAAFMVPGGVGVQEGGFVALCALFGIPPGPAVALSLVKRVPDVLLGLPFIVVWQVLEGRRAFRRPAGAVAVAEPRS